MPIKDRLSAAEPAKAKLSLAPAAEKRLLNRELSLIEFFRQVLDEAHDERNPLLERLRFLTIFSSIVDEFFMVRVSALKEEVEGGWVQPSPDGMTAAEQLEEIRNRLQPMVVEQVRCLKEEILPELAREGIVVAAYDSLSKEEHDEADEYFTQHVFPVLTPLGVDPAHPFPYISGLSLNLGVMVRPLDSESEDQSEPRFVRLKVPPSLPGLVRIGEGSRYALLSEVIAANLGTLFPGLSVSHAHAFRVTRDADIEIREDEADDLLRALQQELRKRRGAAVRLEVSADMPGEMVEYLMESIGVEPDDVYVIDGPLNILDFALLCELKRPDLKYRPLRTTVPAALKESKSIFDAIKRRDVLLHHPYTDYSTVTDFIRAAADDPNVLAIKICLYRTGQQSQIAEMLAQAASEKGKQVTALIELKARFDEENNIEWAQRLERSGVHVVYGLIGLKTHCKMTLVVRREGQALRRYVHIATGNYNPTSSSTYTDLGIFTADEDIGEDATEFFNYLTGYSKQKDYRKLILSPLNLREKLTAMIERETAHAKAGRPGRIVAKLNRLADPNIIQTLYDASAAGVSIDLIMRGICMLRPGVAGVSENIRVRSIIGRFLEHSRVMYFANDGDEEIYIGSADWMPRNLNRRVEIVCPVDDPRLRKALKDEVLAAYLRDNVNARELQPDGSYQRIRPAVGEEAFDSQMYFEGSAGFTS